jgi:hypothetical protein
MLYLPQRDELLYSPMPQLAVDLETGNHEQNGSVDFLDVSDVTRAAGMLANNKARASSLTLAQSTM